FVSHNIAAVKALCDKGLVLQRGRIAYWGDILPAIQFYQNSGTHRTGIDYRARPTEAPGNRNIRLLCFTVRPKAGVLLNITSGVSFSLEFAYLEEKCSLDVTFELRNAEEVPVFHVACDIKSCQEKGAGVYRISGIIPPYFLNAGIFSFSLIFGRSRKDVLYLCDDALSFEIQEEVIDAWPSSRRGLTFPRLEFHAEYLGSTVKEE
ncbi:MAG TPA: hypothetical protein PKO06_16385, partial [Candidatus Ozemobacteraceae bacterium]|nr:hypothetical protein [Candidatus Ozemobacteraceae bacterium]